jgi:D-glycero-alpha-D-manno-heptose-7-phosphate kinase
LHFEGIDVIISRTPLRVSFVGGGSDLPTYYRQHQGAVLSMSIRKYVYLSMHEYFERKGCILKYSEIEKPKTTDEIRHRIIQQIFSDLSIDRVDFNSSADVPAGTGMGSSSAFTVGLLNLCYAYRGEYVSRLRLAELACEIEIDKLGEPIGKQDQYGCALGGINLIQFHTDGTVTYESVPLTITQRRQMEQNLIMFYLGGTRSASQLLTEQAQNTLNNPQVVESLKAMVQQAQSLRGELCRDVDVLGHYLHEGWLRKRSLSAGITNPTVEDAYEKALSAGATGGKLLGAGGSGFLLLYAPGSAREAVGHALSEFQAHSVLVDTAGSTIIYSD